jgi:hypothetical protein
MAINDISAPNSHIPGCSNETEENWIQRQEVYFQAIRAKAVKEET